MPSFAHERARAQPRGARRLPARLPRHLRDAGHRAGRPRACASRAIPDHPPTHGALCTKVSRYAERSYHPERVLQPLKRVGPKGAGQLRAGGLGRGAGRHRRAAEGDRRARPAGHPALQLCRHDGPGAGREHGGALLPQARRLAAGPHHLLQRRRRGADRHLRRQGRHARRALRREPADPDLGQQLDRLEPAFLDLRAGGQARRRQAGVHRPAPHRDRRQVPPAHGAAARHRRRAGAGPDARADPQRLARPRLPRAPCATAGRRCASARCSGRPSAPPRCAACTPRRCAALARDYGTHAAGGDPPELRHAARARRRQCGAADRAAALPGGRLAAPRRRAAAVGLGLVRAGARRRRAAAARPAGRARSRARQHEHHRRRPAARGLGRLRAEDRGAWSSTTATRWRWRRKAARWSRASRAKTCSPWCSSTS